MTANAMQGDREKCLAAGMNDYLTKPIKAKDLEKVLEQWLPQQDSPRNHGESSVGKGETGETQPISQSPASHGQNPSPHIDLDILTEWREMAGPENPDFLINVIQKFIEEAGACVFAAQQALEGQDLEALVEAAHGLKGICGNMGAQDLEQRCAKVVEQGRNGVLEGLSAQIQGIHGEFEVVQAMLAVEKMKSV